MRVSLKPVAGVLVLVGIYAAAGYLGVPAGVRWAVNNVVPDALGGRTASVGDVSFNPWSWTLTIENLAVNSANKPENHMIELDRAVIDASVATLSNMAPVLDAVTVDGLRVQLTANEVNNAQAQETASDATQAVPSKDSGLPAFSLSNISVKNSSVRFVNPGNQAEVNITDINFALPVVSTLPSAGSSSLTPSLSLKINGKPVTAQGKMAGENATLALNIADLDVAQLLRAMPVTIPYDVRSAKLTSALNLDFTLPASGTPGVTASGSATLSSVEAATLQGAPFAKLTGATVELSRFDLANQSVDVKSVAVVDPVINLALNTSAPAAASDASGGKQAGKAESAASSDAGGSNWKWSLGSATITGGSIKVTDQGVSPAAAVQVTGLTLSANDFSSAANATGTYKVSAKVNGGTVASEGKLTIDPLSVAATTNVNSLSLSSFNPWIKSLSGYAIDKGSADVAGSLDFKNAGKTALTWKGTATLKNLQASDPKGAPLASVKTASVDVGLFDLAAQKVEVNKITVAAPALHVAFDSKASQGAAGQGDAAKGAAAQKPAASSGPSAASPWQWSVKSARITEGSVALKDTGLKPAQTLTVSGIALDAANFSSAKGAKGTYKAQAVINGGKLESDGKLSLSPIALEATTNVDNLGFAGFNPWIKSISGASLTKGTADVTGRINLKSADKLAVSWSGDLAVDDFEAKNAAGKTLMTWKQVTGNGIALSSIDPLTVSVAQLTVKEPAQKAVKTTSKLLGIFGRLAEATGHENTARRLDKAEEVVTQDITVKNLSYKDGRFSLGSSGKAGLEALVVDALNNVFTKTSGKY